MTPTRPLHFNNSAAVEPELQKFLSAITPLARTEGGGADISSAAEDSSDENVCQVRDKIRLICEPFAPKTYYHENEDAEEDPEDPLDMFARITPFATTNRHRLYSSEDATSQHADIQNIHRLDVMIKKLGLDSHFSLLDSAVSLPVADSTCDYLALRELQNEDWAMSSISTGRDLLSSGNVDKAISAFNHALEINSKSSVAMLELAKLYMQLKQFDKVIKFCERVLMEVDAMNEEAYQLLMTVVEQQAADYKRSESFQAILHKRRVPANENQRLSHSSEDQRWPLIPENAVNRPVSREWQYEDYHRARDPYHDDMYYRDNYNYPRRDKSSDRQTDDYPSKEDRFRNDYRHDRRDDREDRHYGPRSDRQYDNDEHYRYNRDNYYNDRRGGQREGRSPARHQRDSNVPVSTDRQRLPSTDKHHKNQEEFPPNADGNEYDGIARKKPRPEPEPINYD